MSQRLHPMLERQLQRLGLDAQGQPPDATTWQRLLQSLDRACAGQALDCGPQDLTRLLVELRADRQQLEARVAERTEALRLSEERLRSLLSLSADWIWEQDENLRFTYVSDGIFNATGVTPEALLGQRRMSDDSFDTRPEAMAEYEDCIRARRPFRDFTFSRKRAGGDLRFIRVSGEPVFDADGRFRGYRGISRDVTHAMLAEQKMQDLARFDQLTALPNRSMFLAELGRTIARAARQGLEFALCVVDIDRFKAVNETLGPQAGDELLKIASERLCSVLRRSDLVARLGGDAFVALIEDGPTSVDLTTVARKLLAAVSRPMTLEGTGFLATCSIGIARYPSDGDDAATLLKHADAAMVLAKEKGCNNLQFYAAGPAAHAAEQFALESALRLALVRDELLLHYQPKFDVASGELRGLEALVRWQHPTRGLVPPSAFIPLAEERGLIVPLGRWVIVEACRQQSLWRAAGLATAPVAVNLSALQFADAELVSTIEATLARFGLVAADIEVELTESVLMVDPDRAKEVLCQLHRRGVRISIDDFGTGYSSLSYLKRFPAETVKIDRSFINGLPDDADDTAITQAVIAMAHSLGLEVVAEGVETDAQLAALRRMGCDQVQGYLLGRPMTAAALAALLQPTAERLLHRA